MAEFTEVVKQAKRMCRQIVDCNECPLDLPEGCKMQPYSLPDKWDVEELEKAADIVMDWAAAHLEPRYPTWKEWQEANFPNNDALMRPCIFESEEYFNCKQEIGCEKCMDKPIPADIAEKLGIKPIGGKDDA